MGGRGGGGPPGGEISPYAGTTRAGWVIDSSEPEAILGLLRTLRSEPARHDAAVAAVGEWQVNAGTESTVAGMAAQYVAMYRDVWDARRPLSHLARAIS